MEIDIEKIRGLEPGKVYFIRLAKPVSQFAQDEANHLFARMNITVIFENGEIEFIEPRNG